MKRTFFGVLCVIAACGGRTTLDDSIGDASLGTDGSPIGNDGGPIADATPIVDVIVPPPFDGQPPPSMDAAPPPGGPIQCGKSTCNSSTQVCCVTFNGQTLSETCTPQGQCQGGTFACSSAQSCPNNEVCCATFTQTKQSAQCAPACQGGFQNPQLCASSSECPNGLTCKPSPFGFSVCRP